MDNICFFEKIENLIIKYVRTISDENLDVNYISISNRKDLGQFQSNIAFILAKILGKSPFIIANQLKVLLDKENIFLEINISNPGFLNFTIKNDILSQAIDLISKREEVELPFTGKKNKIIIDYGGVNIAKSMHVGHLRSAVIGESLKRIFRIIGDEVISDIHLGDWGLPMGMLIQEIKETHPNCQYFTDKSTENYSELDLKIEDLERLYPIAAAKCKEDKLIRDKARIATQKLQKGDKNYLALWQKFFDISVEDIRKQFKNMDVSFDLWLGESSVNGLIPELIDNLTKINICHKDQGALVIYIDEENDKNKIPPVILITNDETVTYAMTDLATIYDRVEKYKPDKIIYITDKRQNLHFEQIFRASILANIIDDRNKLEHLGFGTINDLDNKPFKTRDGSAMKLADLFNIVQEKAENRIKEENIEGDLSLSNKAEIIQNITLATVKFADLNHEFKDNYIFDIEKSTNFQGKTGPYILYSAVRIKSILRKALDLDIKKGKINLGNNFEIELALKIIQFPRILIASYNNRSPHILCDYVYSLSQIFSSFYQNCSIIKENNRLIAESRLSLTAVTLIYLEKILYLLGIKIPDYM